MNQRTTITILLLILTSVSLMAQNSTYDPAKKAIEFTLSPNSDSPNEVDELTQLFTELLSSPIHINDDCTKLQVIPIVSDFQISSVADYIKLYGEIKSINEIMFIPGFDKELVDIIAPFISLEKRVKNHITPRDLTPIRHTIITRTTFTVQNAKGFSDTSSSRFLGSKPYYSSSYNMSMGKSILLNIRTEKDAGERALPSKFYHDNLGASITIQQPVKYVDKLIVGDFRLNLGQGLIAWSGFTPGKGFDPTSVRRRSSITASKSYDEVNFYRGISGELKFKPISIAIVASTRNLDGHLSTSDSSKFIINSTGLHRNSKEVEDRATINQKMAGAKVSYNFKRSSLSINAITKKNEGYSTTEKKSAYSTDYFAQWNRHSIFGEVAMDANSNVAFYAAYTLKLSSKAVLTSSYRKYPQTFNITGNNSFGESSSGTNEEGIFIGIKITPQYKYSLSGYVDMFESPYPKYRVSKASSGTEAGLSANGIIMGIIEGRLKYRYKTKELNTQTSPNNHVSTERVTSNKGGIYLAYRPNINVEVTIDASTSVYKTEKNTTTYGYLAYANIEFSPSKIPLRIYSRFSVFDAPSWDVVLYSYEDDLPGMYASSSFYRKGSRAYLMVRANISRRIKIWGKIAETFYTPPTNKIGSGINVIHGNRKTDIKLQVSLNLF